jgi:competence CoiA-like predicted nuclease
MTFKTVNSIAFYLHYWKVQNNTVYYTLQLKDVKDVERYLLSGTLKASAGNNELRLDPTKLLLNYESWKVDADLVRFGTKGIYANNLELSKAQSSIRVQSQSEQTNAPLAIDFKVLIWRR